MHFVDNKNFEAAFLKFVRDLAFCIDKGRVSKTVELLNKGDSRKSLCILVYMQRNNRHAENMIDCTYAVIHFQD